MERNFVGKLTIINNDESHGEILEFNQDILIGRDKECDIRFKLPSISRKHAKIAISSAGKCILHHLSKTNPSIVNGKNVVGSIDLKDNDVVCLADRIFLFSFTEQPISPISSHTLPCETSDSSLPRILNENLKKAIEERRKSLQLPPVDESFRMHGEVSQSRKNVHKESRRISLGKDASFEVAQQVLITPEEIIVLKPVLSTPMKEAIHQRRQSLRNNTVADQLKLDAQPTVMPTPLKKAIQARCKAVTTNPFSTKLSADVDEVDTDTKRSLFSPLKKAICARRKSLDNLQTDDNESVLQSPILMQESSFHLNPISPFHSFSSPQKSSTVPLPQSLKKAIEDRRKSYRDSVGNSVATNHRTDIRKSFASPLRKRLSDCNKDKETPMTDSDAATLKDVLHASSLQITLETVAKHSTGEVDDEVSVALLIQQDSGSILNQVEQRDIVEEVASSTVTPKAKKARGRESLLLSLEKKGKTQYSETITGDNKNIDLVSLLTDEDMELIEAYANLLPQELGLDDTELFAIALDAFIRGMELLYFKQPTVVAETDKPSTDKKNAVTMKSSDMEDDLSDSLRQLFKLPSAFVDASYSEFDEELVEFYAQELQLVSNISEAVAYGVALDTYLSNPVQFRCRVGNLALPEAHYIAYIDAETQENYVDDEDDDNCTVGDAPKQDEYLNNLVDDADHTTANELSGKERNDENDSAVPAKRGRGRKMQEQNSNSLVEVVDNETNQTAKRSRRGTSVVINDEKKTEESIPTAVNHDEKIIEAEIPAKRGRSKRVSLAASISNDVVVEVIPITPAKRTRSSVKTDDDQTAIIPASGRKSSRISSKSSQVEKVDDEDTTSGGRSKLGDVVVGDLQTPAKRSRQVKALQSAGKSNSKGKRKTTKQSNTENNTSESEEEDALAIICDGCDKEYFVDDLGLKSIPDGDWFCKDCSSKDNKKSKKADDQKSSVGNSRSNRK